jgi:hypothetical protein
MRRKLDQVPPERRQEFMKNFERWKNMSPEERQAMRDEQRQRMQRMHKEIDDAIKDSGLTLDDNQRKEFAKRYLQERRKIEHQIMQEMEKLRRPMIKEMVDKLAKEFSKKPSPSPSPSAIPEETAKPEPAEAE